MGLLDELERLEKSDKKSEIAVLLRDIIKNQKKMLKMLSEISSNLEKQQKKPKYHTKNKAYTDSKY